MLAKVAPTSSDFQALAHYLMRGKGAEAHPDRVQWCFTQNLGTDDPLLAARYMEATASRSTRCMKPVYHLMVAWHERERPSAEIMQEVARRTLEMAGLDAHQALVMGHGDTAHKHFHIMLNRVDPETRKAWKTTNDFQRFDRIMRQLSDEYGFEYAPAHSFEPELTDDLPQLPDSKSYRAAKNGADTGRIKWSRRAAREFGEHLSENLDRSTTIEDLNALAADHGLNFEHKGRGIVLGNREGYATLSSLGLTMTANGMLRRKQPAPELHRPPIPQRHWWDVDAVDITRAFMQFGLATREDLSNTINDMQRERAERIAAHEAKPLLPSLSLSPAQRFKPENRTALSTPRDGLSRPLKPLRRPSSKKPTRDYLDALIASQTRRDTIDRRRLLITRGLRLQPGTADDLKPHTPAWDKPPRERG
jgi:hypothetical protein